MSKNDTSFQNPSKCDIFCWHAICLYEIAMEAKPMLEGSLLIAVASPSVGSALLCPRLAALPAPITSGPLSVVSLSAFPPSVSIRVIRGQKKASLQLSQLLQFLCFNLGLIAIIAIFPQL
jgi:hypothetical protein